MVVHAADSNWPGGWSRTAEQQNRKATPFLVPKRQCTLTMFMSWQWSGFDRHCMLWPATLWAARLHLTHPPLTAAQGTRWSSGSGRRLT